MPRSQPPGEEPLSAAAPPRGGQAASGRADWVSHGRARGSPQPPSRTWLRRGGGRGGDSEGWGLGERGRGRIREAQSGGKGEGRARLPSGGEWVRLAPSSRAGRRTRRIRNRERGGRGRPGGRGGGEGGGGGGGQASGPAGGRAGAQREEAASALPDLAAGEFSAQPSRVPSPCPGAPSSGVSLPVRTGGAGLAARPNLVRATRFSSQRAAPRPGGSGPGVDAPAALQLCKDPRPSRAARSAPSCAPAVMADPLAPLATHGGQPAAGGRRCPRIAAPAQPQLSAFLRARPSGGMAPARPR